MLKKKITKLSITRADVIKFLHVTMNETLNEGLTYDGYAEKQFSKEEFNDMLNDYRLFGNLFGSLFINKIIDKLDYITNEKEENNMEYFEKEKTYSYEEIKDTYLNASAKVLEKFTKNLENVENKDPMFGTLSTMLNLQLLTNMYSMMFRERNNNEEKEN